MQNSITANVSECIAKKLSGRLLTIKLAVERINHIKEQDKPSRLRSRVLSMGAADDLEFEMNITKNPWE